MTRKNLRSKKAVEPVVATIIITATIIALVTVAMIFANNLLMASVAQSDFNSAKQYMQSVAMQIDDVAWQIGQTETVSYSTRYGAINVLNGALSYNVSMTPVTGSTQNYVFSTGIIYFYMPVSYYSLANNYFSQVWPLKVSNLVNNGSSSPVATVFAIEKMPMSDGEYIRVVVAPVLRLIQSSIAATNYLSLYLPILSLASSPRLSQSVTLKGNSISTNTLNSVKSLSVTVSFPNSASGFDNTFFNFPLTTQSIPIQGTCVAQLYTGSVGVSLGANE